jgi:hypothetical protein
VSETEPLLPPSKSLLRNLISHSLERASHLKYIVHPIYVAKLWKKGGASEKRDVIEKFLGYPERRN